MSDPMVASYNPSLDQPFCLCLAQRCPSTRSLRRTSAQQPPKPGRNPIRLATSAWKCDGKNDHVSTLEAAVEVGQGIYVC